MTGQSRHIYITPRGARVGGTIYPCSIGKNGTTLRKFEGDGSTPSGTHDIIGLLYRPDRMKRPTDWALPIGPRDIWSDDCMDPDYNMMGYIPRKFRYERLFRADPLYDLILLTNWNWPYAIKGRGSAIFLHPWRKPGHPTEGCIAFDPMHLLQIARRIRFGTKVIVHHR